MQYHTASSSSSSSSDTAYDHYHVGPICTLHDDPVERVARVASRSAVVMFSISTCCMCHAAKQLFSSMGVSPTVHELDRDPLGEEMERVLMSVVGTSRAGIVPVVFIGGKLVGSMDRVMASHISGSLVPLLKEAGALWL